MPTIADSSAVRDGDRVFPQHQAALTLLQGRLGAPATLSVGWLDLACGRGQIITSLDEHLSAEARAKIAYSAYDVNVRYAEETAKTAGTLGFRSWESKTGDLSDFDRLLPSAATFDFITLTNTVHEIAPTRLARLLADAIGRLAPQGTLFVYDMERIEPLELGAVPWDRGDIRRILVSLLDALGATDYRPEVGRWSHRTTSGWSVQLQRDHFGVSDKEFANRRDEAVTMCSSEIAEVLDRRLATCRKALETLTRWGAETAEEQKDKERLLYEFWALSRALGTA